MKVLLSGVFLGIYGVLHVCGEVTCMGKSGHTILTCEAGSKMVVTSATYGQEKKDQCSDLQGPDGPASQEEGLFLASIDSLGGSSAYGNVEFVAMPDNILRLKYGLKGLIGDSSGGFSINGGTCAAKGALYTHPLSLSVWDDVTYNTANIGWATDLVDVSLGVPFDGLINQNIFIYDASGAAVGCAKIGSPKCNFEDVTASVAAECNGWQKCLYQGSSLPAMTYPAGCSDASDYLDITYNCQSASTSQPTKQPTMKAAWSVPPSLATTNQPTKQPTKQPTPQPDQNQPAPVPEKKPGFDFSGGCSGGSGSFTVDLTKGDEVILGIVPALTVGLDIQLEATDDVDITLYDVKDMSSFHEGLAVIKWCDSSELGKKKFNCGILGEANPESTVYQGATIDYSGFSGVDKNAGKEFVKVSGATPTIFNMGAYAYETGTGVVTYSYTGLQTPCCMGVANACGGTFRTTVKKGEVTEIGQIPPKKKDLLVTLDSQYDIDIQLYNVDKTFEFAEGEAIVAYCKKNDCNYGDQLTSATPIAGDYEGMSFEYSGWDGVRGYLGSESIRISGVTTQTLSMGLLGYKAGSASVTYSYTEPV